MQKLLGRVLAGIGGPEQHVLAKAVLSASMGTDISGVLDKHCDVKYRWDPEHPWDQELRDHILEEHAEAFQAIAKSILWQSTSYLMLWDYYKEACAAQERKQFPIVGFFPQNGERWSTSLTSTTTSAFTVTFALHVPKSSI